MKRIVDYLLVRPISALFNGVVIGLILPLTTAGKFGERYGRTWAWLFAPLWFIAIVLAIPVSILYCFVMVMWKGPYWQYPRGKRTSFDVTKLEQVNP